MAVKKAPTPAAAFDPFASAPTIAGPKPKSRSKERTSVELGDDLDKLAAFKVLEKLLESEQKILRSFVEEQVIEVMAKDAFESGKKPESFDGTGTLAIASCQIAKKAKTSRLTPEIADELRALKLPIGKTVTVESRLILNPDLDQETLTYLAKLVGTDPKLKSKMVVMRQAEDSFETIAEDTIDELAKQPLDVIRRLLPKVANFSIGKFRFDGAAIEADKDSAEAVTPEAKANAIAILQDMGVLPAPAVVEVVAAKKKRA